MIALWIIIITSNNTYKNNNTKHIKVIKTFIITYIYLRNKFY